MVGGNTNKEFLAIQGPKTTPKQTQGILKNLIKVGKPINMQGFRAMMPGFMEFAPAVDEMTGGHVDQWIQKGVNQLRMMIGQKPNEIRNNYQ